MKLRFPRHLHISILTCLAVLFAVLFSTPKVALAACIPVSDAGSKCDLPTTNSCTKTVGSGKAGSVTQYFCCTESPTECSAGSTTGTGSENTNVGIKNGNATIPADPKSKTCPNAIPTALGCLPFGYGAFTNTAFRWLVSIAGALSLASMLYATIMRALAGDNHEVVKKSNEQFTAGATGLLFIILSVTILSLMAGQILMVPGF